MMPRLTAAVLFSALLAGCQAAPARPRIADEAAAITGDVAVRVEERPAEAVDVGEPSQGILEPAEAIRRAVLHDPALQASLARLRSAWADAAQVRLLPNPVMTVGVRFREGGGSPIVDAALAADLLSLLQMPRRISAADARLRAAAGESLATLADTVSDVQESYFTVQAMQDELAALDERRKLSERLVELGRARLKVGEAASLDVIALETQRLELEVDVAEKLEDLAEARIMLARLIGEPSSSAEWKLAKWNAPPAARAPESEWLAAAMRGRAEVRSKQWELAALGDEVKLAKWAFLEGSDIGVQSERDMEWSVGPELALPLPFFDWGQARQDKAKAELAAARHEMVKLQRQVVQDVRTQYSAYNSTLRTLGRAREELLPLQERRASQAEASYKAGETDVANLLLAEEDLLDARVKVIELQKKTAVARVKLQRAVGGVGIAAAVDASTTQPATSAPAGAPASNPATDMRGQP